MDVVGSNIACGVLPSELVIRGGGLEKPIVLTELKEESGKRFFHLVKDNENVALLLTGACKSRRLLANSLTIEHLGRLRDDKFNQLAAELGGQAGGQLAASEEDVLGLVAVSASTPSPRKARVKLQIQSQMPTSAAVEIELPDGTMWRPVVLLTDRKTNPHMEATTENFNNLYILVQHDLSAGEHKRERHGAGREADEKKEPRVLDNGSREYWVEARRRWVQKKPIQEDSLEEEPDNKKKDEPDNKRKKYTSLYRVPSDESVLPSRGRGRGRGRGRRATANEPPLPIQAGPAEAVDSLGLGC
jgi:hypothetical protein